MIFRSLMYKWFGIEELPCNTCEVLRMQLAESNAERKDLLNRLLQPSIPEPLATKPEEFEPIKSQFVPWRVRQQLLEQEDRKRAELLKKNATDIAELEKELQVK
jgi:hypothetical protein